MSHQNAPEPRDAEQQAAAQYEPPRVESVLTAEDLAREIQYAGLISQT